MKYGDFVKKCSKYPIIDSKSVSTIFQENFNDVVRQFGRWVNTGKLIQLKKGIYLLPEEFRINQVSGFYISSVLLKPSYISMEKAMEFYNLIPESVFVYTSLTSRRANNFNNSFGKFTYRHIKQSLFWGYDTIEKEDSIFYLAYPEKALLDYIYVNRINPDKSFFDELRLQNTEIINIEKLLEMALRFKRKNILKAAQKLIDYISGMNKKEKLL